MERFLLKEIPIASAAIITLVRGIQILGLWRLHTTGIVDIIGGTTKAVLTRFHGLLLMPVFTRSGAYLWPRVLLPVPVTMPVRPGTPVRTNMPWMCMSVTRMRGGIVLHRVAEEHNIMIAELPGPATPSHACP